MGNKALEFFPRDSIRVPSGPRESQTKWKYGFLKDCESDNTKSKQAARPVGEKETPRLLISAGEVSGDQVGALLARSVKKRCDLDIVGLGGSRMKAAGVAILQDTNLLGSVGLTEPLKTVPGVLETFLKIRKLVQASPPHAAVLIGHDVFHMIMGRYLRAKKIPVVAYFPPQVWIWRSLARPISRCYDLVPDIVSEEEEIYKGRGRNPLCRALPGRPNRACG